MGVKILVKDRRNNPRKNDMVSVKWHPSGQSNGRTNDYGVFDTGTTGNVESVTIYGKQVFYGGKEGVKMGSDAYIEVEYNGN